MGPALAADQGEIYTHRHAKARLSHQMGHFITAGHTRDDGTNVPSGISLTCENVWELFGLRSRVRRFESCRGHPV